MYFYIFVRSWMRILRKHPYKRKKPGSALLLPLTGLPSPLRCLTSVFGMGTGVTTAPSPPDFFRETQCSLKTGYWSTCSIQLQLLCADLAYSSINIELVKLSPRAISNGQLNTLLCLHFRPINLLTLEGPYFFRMGSLILWSVSRLDAFSVYPFQR